MLVQPGHHGKEEMSINIEKIKQDLSTIMPAVYPASLTNLNGKI